MQIIELFDVSNDADMYMTDATKAKLLICQAIYHQWKIQNWRQSGRYLIPPFQTWRIYTKEQ